MTRYLQWSQTPEASHAELARLVADAGGDIAATMRLVIVKRGDDWRLAFGRIDVARAADVPIVEAQDLASVRVLVEQMPTTAFLPLLEEALHGRPLVCSGIAIAAHGMEQVWRAHHADDERQDYQVTWPCVIASSSPIPDWSPEPTNLLPGHGAIPTYDGLDGVIAHVSGIRSYHHHEDGRRNHVHLLFWNYRGRIRDASVTEAALTIRVEPGQDPDLDLRGRAVLVRSPPMPFRRQRPADETVPLPAPARNVHLALFRKDELLEDRYLRTEYNDLWAHPPTPTPVSPPSPPDAAPIAASPSIAPTENPGLIETLLVGTWFTPPVEGYISAPAIGITLTNESMTDLEQALRAMVDRGLLDATSQRHDGHPMYLATPAALREREANLRRLGRRTACLLRQRDHRPADLLLAFAMAGTIQNRRIPGGFLGGHTATTIEEIETALTEYAPGEIIAAMSELDERKLIQRTTIRVHGRECDALQPTVLGQREYAASVRGRLELGEQESILDIPTTSAISIFWAWQSDFRTSRNQITDALEKVASLKWNSVAPIVIETAAELGDGAIRIDVSLMEKIQRCTFFVGDITPVIREADRLYPNANVLIEVGFALASKPPDAIFLVASQARQHELNEDGRARLPFDIEHVNRITYPSPAELRKRLEAELRARMTKKGLLR